MDEQKSDPVAATEAANLDGNVARGARDH